MDTIFSRQREGTATPGNPGMVPESLVPYLKILRQQSNLLNQFNVIYLGKYSLLNQGVLSEQGYHSG